MMGSGGMIVMDESTCMVDVAKYFMNFLKDESCGKCTSCREGTKRMHEILTEITEGRGTWIRSIFLKELGWVTAEASLCQLGGTAPNPVLSTLRYFRDEYEEHILQQTMSGKGLSGPAPSTEFSPMSARGAAPASRPVLSEAITGKKKTKKEPESPLRLMPKNVSVRDVF